MSSAGEAVLFVAMAVVLALIHKWNDNRTLRNKAAAQEALRLGEFRQRAVQQLKFEQRAWSVRADQEDTPRPKGASLHAAGRADINRSGSA
jgi:hypothetical protein